MKQEMLWKLRAVRLVWLRRCTGALLFQTDGCAFVSLWASGTHRDRRTLEYLEMCLIVLLSVCGHQARIVTGGHLSTWRCV